MRAIAAARHTHAVTGGLFPPTIPHLLNQSIDQETRRLLVEALPSALCEHARRLSQSRGHALLEATRRNKPLRELFSWRGSSSCSTFVYKEPFLAFAPELATQPGFRSVYLVRDGRDCALSMVKTYNVLSDDAIRTTASLESPIARHFDGFRIPWWVTTGREEEFVTSTQFVRATWMWAAMVGRLLDAPERTHQALLVVKYETLMADPVVVGTQIFEHLGIEGTSSSRRRLRSGHANSISAHMQLPAAERRAATLIAARELKAFDYLS